MAGVRSCERQWRLSPKSARSARAYASQREAFYLHLPGMISFGFGVALFAFGEGLFAEFGDDGGLLFGGELVEAAAALEAEGEVGSGFEKLFVVGVRNLRFEIFEI